MTNAESPGASGQELPVSPREKWRGKLKLHSFLVYFYLWAIAIYKLVGGVSLLERQEPSEIFRLYPKLTVLNSVTGALMIVWCLGLAVSAVRLARFFCIAWRKLSHRSVAKRRHPRHRRSLLRRPQGAV